MVVQAEHPEWFTIDGLRRWIGLGRSKTYELVASGEIPSYRFGRIRRVRRSDIEAWLENNRYQPGK